MSDPTAGTPRTTLAKDMLAAAGVTNQMDWYNRKSDGTLLTGYLLGPAEIGRIFDAGRAEASGTGLDAARQRVVEAARRLVAAAEAYRQSEFESEPFLVRALDKARAALAAFDAETEP